MKRIQSGWTAIVALIMVCGAAVAEEASNAEPAQFGDRLARAVQVERGLYSVLGCDDRRLVMELAGQGRLLVHAIDSNQTVVDALRQQLDHAGHYGSRAVVERGEFKKLPYADNLVDIVVVPNLTEQKYTRLSVTEILRVLRPKGIALFGLAAREAGGSPTERDLALWLRGSGLDDFELQAGLPGVWARVVKPEPAGVDDWSHWQHGPDNNPASNDQVIKAPYLTQWTGTPYYIAMPAITTAAGGRTFCAMGHIAHHEREEPWLNTLMARNGYNGIELWRRRLPAGYLVHRSAFVATDDVFYMIDEDGNGCQMLDPQTGKELGEIKIDELTGQWKWISIEDGILYILSGEMQDSREMFRARNQNSHWSWNDLSRGYYRRQIPWGFGHTIAAYDLEKKELLWKHNEEGMVDSRAMSMAEGKIFFYGPYSHVGCIYAKTGKVAWTNPSPRLREMVQEQGTNLSSTPGFRTEPFCLYTPEVLVFAPQTNEYVCGVSTEDGKLLWHRKKTTSNPNPLYADGELLIGVGNDGNTLVVDLKTGKTVRDLQFKKRSCTRLTSTPDSFFCRGWREGTTRFDRNTKKVSFNGAMRPSCNDGVVPANGMLYIGPWLCDCNLALMGAMGLCSAGDFQFEYPVVESERLEVFAGSLSEAARFKVASDEWSAHRGNNDHSGSIDVKVPAKKTIERWTFTPDRPMTAAPPVAAGGLVFHGGIDGKLRAIDAETGEIAWTYLTAGPIRASATVWNGRVYIGSGDGFVYCLEAATGKPLWRFRASPVERRIMVYDHLCSAWPVNTGVLVADGVAYFGAGLIDTDGTYVYALDAVTGKCKWQNNSVGHMNPEIRKGVSAHGRLTIADGKLYMAGGNVVSPAVFDLATGECISKQDVKGPPAANRGEEIAVINDEFVLLGGRLMFSAFENVVNPGYFDVINLAEPKHAPSLISGKIPPVWDDDIMVYVNGRNSRIRACDLTEIEKVLGKRNSEGEMEKRWVADIPEIQDTVSLAMGSNAIVAVCQLKPQGEEKNPGWGVIWISRKTGEMLWEHRLESRPLSGGLLIDGDGQMIVTLEDGKLVCIGREKRGFNLFAQSR